MNWLTAPLAAALLGAALSAQSPTLSYMMPPGGQRGTEVVVTCNGARIGNTLDVLFWNPGIDATKFTRKNNNTVEITFRIDAGCPLGEHPIRLHTDRGISTMRLFWVGELPELVESAQMKPVVANDTRAEAQKIPLGVTVNGSISGEDIDYFMVDVPKGEVLKVDVQGDRIGTTSWDPFVAVFDAQGSLVAESDDTPLGRLDPMCSVRSKDGGTYYIELRESSYGGATNAMYRMHVGIFPRPTGTLPAGGRPGEMVEIAWLGEDGDYQSEKVRLPKRGGRHQYFPRSAKGVAPSSVWLSVRNLPNVVEPQEAAAEAIEIEAPAAINGVLLRPGEVDRYRFKAKKGVALSLWAVTRSLRSPVDPVMTWSRPGGSGENDDSGGSPDSRLNITPPADHTYEVTIRDRLGHGGPGYFYRIEIFKPSRPAMSTRSSFRRDAEFVAVPRGGRMLTIVTSSNKVDGTKLLLQNLPPGVVATVGDFARGKSDVPVVLEAAADAPLRGQLATLGLLAPGRNDVRSARYRDNLSLVRVRNNNAYLNRSSNRLPVAVTKKAPFSVEIVPPEVPIVRGSPLAMKVRVVRGKDYDGKKDFKGSVRVRLPWLPPGITASEYTVPGDKTEGTLNLSANGSAGIRKWQVAAYGYSTISGGILRIASKLTDLEVIAQRMTASLGKARAEQGAKTEMTVTFARTKTFVGGDDVEVEVDIINLPRGVKTTGLQKIKAGTKKLVFPFALDAKAPPGKHRLLLRLVVPSKRGKLVHYFRGGELRIDRPLKRKPAKKGSKKVSKKKPGSGSVAKPKT